MREREALVHYRCASAKHQLLRGAESDTLTIHQGKWAYCPHDIRAKGHEWTATGGQTLAQLRLGQRRPS
ncbi:MAG TPA: hypothetical protein VGK15_06580 [Candidatus Limnocylindria bacterium]